jgi:hypothetical protein
MDNTGFNYFENTGYRNERKRMHTIYLKNDTHSHNDNHAFECHLIEPLRLGKVGEVFLDYFMTYDIGADNANANINKQAFVMDIKEFNIQSKSNLQRLHSKMIIPNDDAAGTSTKVHKGRKMNYVATINPGIYHKLSGTITDLAGGTMLSSSLASAAHLITFGANPTGGTITVVAHGLFGVDFTGTVTIASSGGVDGTQLADAGHIFISNATAVTGGDLSATITNIINRFTHMFSNVGVTFTAVSGPPEGIRVTGLNGGTISSSGVVAGEDSADVDIDSPHFIAEFVIIEKD